MTLANKPPERQLMGRPGRALANNIAQRQRGFSLVRAIAVLVVLVGILLVPLWQNREAKKTARPAQVVRPKASAPSVVQPATSPATAAPGTATPAIAADANGTPTSGTASPDRLGLSFGHGRPPASSGSALMFSACAGDPKDAAGPCNPTQGDMSCRTALPVLCVLPDGSAPSAAGLPADTPLPSTDGSTATVSVSAAWVGGTLGATAPVAGFVLGSLAQAHARCAAELGAGWRMAQVQDAPGGGGLVGKRGQGLTNTNTRHWVHTSDQKAHCWDAS